jgi:hypothetical protein
MIRKSGLQALLLLLVLGLTVGVRAQVSTTGSITGTVRDPQGAAVPKAEVTITEETTNVSRTVTADDNGVYTALGLPAGRYTVSTAPHGFKKTVNSGIDLHIGDKLNVDLKLEVGTVDETVTVTGEAAQVETRSSDVSSLVTQAGDGASPEPKSSMDGSASASGGLGRRRAIGVVRCTLLLLFRFRCLA